MAKRVKISTKTTRNEEFNYYETQYQGKFFKNTVTSATATSANPNIRLLDVNEAIIKTGSQIAEDALQNTTMIEISFGFDSKLAGQIRDFALNGIPSDPAARAVYERIEAILKQEYGKTYDDIKSMVIDYTDYSVLGKYTAYHIFGAPEQVVLNNRQHFNNCGIESTLNTLAMAGIIKMNENLKDQEKVEKNFLTNVWERNLAGDNGDIGVLDEPDGGTRPDDYRDIMEYFGISSHSYYITNKSDKYVYPKAQINQLAYDISQGHGAVVGVCSDVLWNEAQSESEEGTKKIDHAIAITGVVYDKANPTAADTPIGFYIHDTGAWMTRFITLDEFLSSTLCDYLYADENDETVGHKRLNTLKEYDSKTGQYIEKSEAGIFVTLTDEPIKTDVFNLDATGDKSDNIIWGNNSDNVIKGMKGNDTLYGRAGNDTIYGGADDDIVVGNNAFKFVAKVGGKDYTCDDVEDFKVFLKKADKDISTRLASIAVDDYGSKTFDSFSDAYDYIQSIVPKGINTLYGDAGSDIIIGGEQADLIYGGKGKDYIYGGDGRNAIYGGADDDVIVGGYDNDKLFGDAGNDYIFGLADDDTIDGGAGHDHIYGGDGDDRIETGKGNDTVYFEGTKFGTDIITSKGGNTAFKFIDNEIGSGASRVSDMFFDLGSVEDSKKNMLNLQASYKQTKLEDGDTGIQFQEFYNSKKNKSKVLTISDVDGDYKVSVSNKSSVSTTKGVNNVLLTTCDSGTIIATSDKNDVVTMLESDNDSLVAGVVDTISYSAGKDKYVSQDRDTYYTVNKLDSSTNLSIYDNVIGLTKFDGLAYLAAVEEAVKQGKDPSTVKKEDYTYKNVVSKDDRLYIGSEKKANYLFDVSVSGENAITTKNSGLYLLNGINYANVVKGSATGGFIYMDSFFKYDSSTATQIATGKDFYGNGQIESIYYSGSENPYDYTNDLTGIASSVAGWLSSHTTYTSAFDVFRSDNQEDITALINLYTA